MREFTEQDVARSTVYTAEMHKDLVWSPTDWQKRGLQETATGYGSKLNTGYKISFNGKLYRVYCTCYSNCGSYWFTVKSRKIYVH